MSLEEGYIEAVRLWSLCRGGMGGYAVLPRAGGALDQPAWLMDAFAIMDAAECELRSRE